MSTYAERVARGATEILDEHFPGWEWDVKITTLLLEDCSQCVLGQLKGDYFNAVRQIFQENNKYRFNKDLCEKFGFTINVMRVDDEFKEWRALTAAWKDLIRARRAAYRAEKKATVESE